MYPQLPRELDVDLKGSAEHTLGATALQHWSQLLFSLVTFMNLYLVRKMVSGIHCFLYLGNYCIWLY